MIATESGAEGRNLQFCSLVVNYDLPWNPQRIGRCHRYGQKHDVVVINFLNRMVFSAIDDNGNPLDAETCEKLFMIAGEVGKELHVSASGHTILESQFDTAKAKIVQGVAERNQAYFEDEMDKLENWAEDLKQGLERE